MASMSSNELWLSKKAIQFFETVKVLYILLRIKLIVRELSIKTGSYSSPEIKLQKEI